jgi:hypothetical protein
VVSGGTVRLDVATLRLVRFAARMFEVSESEIVARAVKDYTRDHETHAAPPRDPWGPVAIYAEYRGQRITGTYLQATKRVVVTSQPLADQSFTSATGAARAVVAALNPERAAAQTNGWRFWRVEETGRRLETLRW